MLQFKRMPIVGTVVVGLLAASACSSSSTDGQRPVREEHAVSTTTRPAVGDAGPISWATYRATNSLDPIKATDLPENVVVTSLCETLLFTKPDHSISPGLATSATYDTPTRLVLTLQKGVKFWDGSPLTPADVAYSLNRARDPKGGGYFADSFRDVTSISPTGQDQVTITLSKPNYWLRGALSTMAGAVVEKAFADRVGEKKFGTGSGTVMCTGPFKLSSWDPGGDVVVVRNDDYWNASMKAKVPKITFTPVTNDSTLLAGFKSGEISGTYVSGSSVHDALVKLKNVTVTSGPALSAWLLAVGDPKGALGDVRVRQALSLAMNREDYIQAVDSGQGSLPRSMSPPASFGYARDVFESTLGKLPEMKLDADKAKALMSKAGAEGRSVTMVIGSGVAAAQTMATVVQEACQRIGLKFVLKTIALDKYADLFYNPEARKGVDLFPTINGPIYGDPGPFLATIATPGGPYNFLGYSNSQVTRLLDQARSTADDSQRASLTAEADEAITKDLPMIPLDLPYNVLYTGSSLTGAPASDSYNNGPWANLIGAAK